MRIKTMNYPNRRADDRHPTTPLRWNDRWTLLLTGPTSGVVGPLGEKWPNQAPGLERVDVCVLREDFPVAVFRTGGEGAGSWFKLDLVSHGTPTDPLRDGEQLYRAGTVPKLESIEQYRLQMVAIGTAAFGYWREGDTIHADYDTVPPRDVIAERRRQIEQEGYAPENDDAHAGGEIAAYAAFYAMPPAVRELRADGYDFSTLGEAVLPRDWTPPKTGDRRRELVKAGALILAEIERMDREARPAVPDAVDAALTDAIVHGTGAFRVHGDGSTEHVDLQRNEGMDVRDVTVTDPYRNGVQLSGLSEEARRHYAELAAFPPNLQRDALYQDYAVPKPEGDPK